MIEPKRTAGLVVLFLLTYGCGGTDPAPDVSADGEARHVALGPAIDAFIEDVIAAHDVPGVTAAVVRDGEVVYSKAFGVESVDTGEALSPQHLFHFASVSKPFVATAIMQLVEAGKIDLDAAVTTYLPYFELADPEYEAITIRQMLNHTSGMPDVSDYEWDNPQTDEGAAEQYVRALAGEKMIGPPGGQTVYSNRAFDTLGDVIAKVSGQSFEDYMKAQILEPLGMNESTFFYPATDENLRTVGHVWNLRPVVSEHYPYNRRHAPSSTLNSSVHEMTRWAEANLNRGELDGSRILEEASYEELWTPSAEMGTNHVGLSWFLGEIDGARTISHGGGDTGFSSYFLMMPDENAAFIVASNYDRTPMGELRDGLVALLLGNEPPKPQRPIGYDFARIFLEQGLDEAKAFYRQAADERAEEFSFSDQQLNTLGYYLLGQGEVDRAVEVFAYNVELYPDIGNCYDSLGEAYLAKGENEPAIANYGKALELDPDNDNARRILGELGAPAPAAE